MFVFRSRRSNLVRRLWKLHQAGHSDGEAGGPVSEEERRSLTAMLGRLKEPQLEGLVRALETRGGEPGPCCPVPANQRRPSDQSEAWLMARVFRGWGEDTGAMVRLPWCDQGDTDIYTCCNPFHWARVVTPDAAPNPHTVTGASASALPGNSSSTTSTSSSCSSPSSSSHSSSLPSYASHDQGRAAVRRQGYCSIASTEGLNSLATDGESIGDSALTWCRLAYWEERTRVGAQVSGTKRALEVFSSQPRPSASHDAVSLETLHSLNPKPSQATLRTREKIGLGLILSRDESGVWVHNRSQVPLFVNSPTLDVPNSRTFSVFKIPPGFSMQVFSWDLARLYSTIRDPAAYDGPFDPHSLRLSFAKGWGGSYARQYVECCPCWLEIMLTPPR